MWELLIFFGGMALGWFWQARRVGRVFLDDPQRIIDLLEQIHGPSQPQGSQEPYRVEWIDGQCYLWQAETGEFLGQGQDPQQVLDRLAKTRTWRQSPDQDSQNT